MGSTVKTVTLADARNLYALGRLQMRVNKHGRIECMVNGQLVKVTRKGNEARAAYCARSLRIGG